MLLPMIFLVLNAAYFSIADRKIKSVMLNEKYLEIVSMIDMLAAAVEANKTLSGPEHEAGVVKAMEHVDQLYQVYAAVYRFNNGKLELITHRNFETSIFEPMDFTEFAEMIDEQGAGKLVIGYTPEHQAHRELHLYFRWTPLYLSHEERFLLIAGVSEHSILTPIPLWIAVGQWASMFITFALTTWVIILAVRLGHVYKQRSGGEKWRDEWGF